MSRGEGMDMKNAYREYNQAEIDYRINKYTLKCLAIIVIAMILVWIVTILNIFIVNTELASKGIFLGASVTLVTIGIGKHVDLHKSWVKYFLVLGTVVAVTIVGITLTYHTVLFSVFPLLLATQYIDKKMIVYSYLLSVASMFAIVLGGYFWGLCDANMLILTTEQTDFYRNQAAGIIEFEAGNTNPWYTLTLYYVIPRCALLLTMLPVIQSISSNVMEHAAYAESMKRLSERDEMTGLYNKNKFLHMIKGSYPKEQSVGVIFWDVNNLKETNDNLGHDQGDLIITTVAHIIMKLTDINRKAYRIGGDEFVMVVENPGEDEIEEMLERWREELERKASHLQKKISVATGYAVGDGKEIEAIVKKADQNMYRRKREQKAGRG